MKSSTPAGRVSVSADMGAQTYIFPKNVSTTLLCLTGYLFNDYKSRHCSGSTPFYSFVEKTNAGTPIPMDVLEHKTFRKIKVVTLCGSTVTDHISSLAQVRGSDD